MKKSIDEINNIIENINIYINTLLSEQVVIDPDRDPSDGSEEDELNKLKNQKGSGERINTKEVYRDIKNGNFEKIFPPDELKKMEEWRDSGYKTGDYTIEDGKYAGKVITSAAYDSFRVAAGYKSVKTKILKNKPKKYISPDVCNCIALARMYVDKGDPADEQSKCSNPKDCEEKFMDDFEKDMSTRNEYDRKSMTQYLEDCREHSEIIFDIDKRKGYLPACENWNEEAKPTIDNIESELTNLLSQWFRISKQKSEKLNKSEEKTVATEIGKHNEVRIKFDNALNFVNGPAPFDKCETYSEDLAAGTTLTFKVVSYSSLNKGKTVVLEKSGKYAKMTFKHSRPHDANEGKITWLDGANDGSPDCALYNWEGEIKGFT